MCFYTCKLNLVNWAVTSLITCPTPDFFKATQLSSGQRASRTLQLSVPVHRESSEKRWADGWVALFKKFKQELYLQARRCQNYNCSIFCRISNICAMNSAAANVLSSNDSVIFVAFFEIFCLISVYITMGTGYISLITVEICCFSMKVKYLVIILWWKEIIMPFD